MKKKESRRAPSFMEPLEGRQLLSTGTHTVSPTKLTFSSNAANGVLGTPISLNVAAKITANGLPLRTATVYFVVDGQHLLGQGVSGRSGYVTATIPNIFANTHSIAAYFLKATRYAASTSKATTVTETVPALTTTSDGLQYATVTAGSGAAAVSGQTASVNYAGYLTTGSLFDTSFKTTPPTQFPLILDSGGSIAGFNEGVKGMKVGETRVLIIPPSLGYGSNPPQGSSIPTNATLIFFVKLESIS
jgi:FKBP-type peptidyl-prolyl cis-trans isomerase